MQVLGRDGDDIIMESGRCGMGVDHAGTKSFPMHTSLVPRPRGRREDDGSGMFVGRD